MACQWSELGVQPDGDIKRLICVLEGGIPDRVPYWEYWVNSQDVIQAVLGHPMESIRDRYEFALRTGQDAFVVSIGWRPGCVFGQASNGTSHYLDGSIRCFDDLRDLQPPDTSGFFAQLEEALEISSASSIGVYVMLSSIFDGTYLGMGLEAFSVALYENRALVEALMDKLTDFFCEVSAEVAKYEEVKIVQFNDDIARKGGLWIRPELFRELWVPRMEKILEPLREAGKLLTFHTDGTLDDVIPILVSLGFRAVHPVEFAANDIRQLKERFGQQICLHGNVPTTMLCYDTPEQVYEFVAELVQELKPGGYYICSSTTSIFPGVKVENFAAMIRAVQENGRY